MLTFFILLIIAFVFWSIYDYRQWIALGKGGLPHTLKGWLTLTHLRIRAAFAGNPLDTTPFERNIGKMNDMQILNSLPKREGERPKLAVHPIPQRQTNQHTGTPSVFQDLQAIFDKQVEKNSLVLFMRLSHFEKHTPAIFFQEQCCRTCSVGSFGEIGHIHPSDKSMHIILSPSDAKIVTETGWGERHALAGVGDELILTYMFIYAPRNEEDNKVIEKILEAAVNYVAGI